eukprot:401175-Lingulodinium_polyedra.AAC.1
MPPKRLGLAGNPRNSWVWIGRANAGRSTWNPAGDARRDYARTHNELASISTKIVQGTAALGLHCI